MKKATIVYWVATGLLALMMTKSALAYLMQEAVRAECQRLGFPDYFRVELAVAKLLGVLALLAPVGRWPKEWAYAGFAIILVSALIAHAAVGDPPLASAGIGVLLGQLGVSYRLWRQRTA